MVVPSTLIATVLGQLVQQTDAKSQVATFTYDKLGRLLTRVEPDLTGTWGYDTATKGIGKLAGVTGSTNAYSRTHTYDSLGRPSGAGCWSTTSLTTPRPGS